MSGAASWILPSLIAFFCLVLASLSALSIYVACYRCKFHRATSTAAPSSASDCERGLIFSPAWNTRGVGVPSQELLLYQLCMKDTDGDKPGERMAGDSDGKQQGGADAAALKDGFQSQTKAASNKVHHNSDGTRTAADAPPTAGRTGEGEKSQGVPSFREKYATRFLSPTGKAPQQKDVDCDEGARKPPAMTKGAGDGEEEEEDIDAFYTPPQSPPRSHHRMASRPEPEPPLMTAGRGRGCGHSRGPAPGMTPVMAS